MKTYVIDASVAAKWFFEEPLRSHAREYIVNPVHRIAPDILYMECANAIRKRIKTGAISSDKGVELFSSMESHFERFMTLSPSFPLIHSAFSISGHINNHPMPDCVYLALALRADAILVTADRRLYDACRMSEYSNHIRWIEEPIDV